MKKALDNLINHTGFSEKDLKVLKKTAPAIKTWIPGFVKIFYEILLEHEPTARILQPEKIEKLEISLANWFDGLLENHDKPDFWEYQWNIGLLHLRRNIHTHLMISMMNRFQTLFLAQSVHEFGPAYGTQVYIAFKRITDIISGLIAEGYFEGYLTAMANVSRLSRKLMDRMVVLEVEKLARSIPDRRKYCV